MTTTDPLGQVQAFRMRLTKLDSNGVPTPGAGKMYVTSSLVTLSTTPVYKEGTEIEQENGAGEVCVYFTGDPTFKKVQGEITICTPDPRLMEFLGGCAVLTDGNALGFAYPPLGTLTPTPISVELWTKRVDDGVVDDEFPYGWWVLPRVKNLRIGAAEFGNMAVLPKFTFNAYENANWYDGPLNNFPVASDRVLQMVPCVAADVPAASSSALTVAAS